MINANRAKILDVHEIRACATPFEYRENRSGEIVLEGYAATYEPYDVMGGEARGGWREQIQPTAFDATLATKPDLQLLVNHEGCPLARTKSGTLQVTRDGRGLRVRAGLDPSDPDVQKLVPKMQRGDMDEMSFGFRVKDQIWNTDYTQRTITEVSLNHGDVSVVNYGANPTTSAKVSIGMLAELSSDQLLEIRRLDPDLVERALANLAELRDSDGDGKKKKPYGDVAYADPANGKYPIDTEAHARAAWSYINMPKNQAQYSPAQLATIKGHIKSALKKFGVDVSDDDKKSAGWAPISIPAVEDTRAGTPPPPDVPPEIDDRGIDDDMPKPGVEAFTPDNDVITIGPIAAALSRTITDAYKLTLDNGDTVVIAALLAKAAELLERARTGDSDISVRLRSVRDAGRLPSQIRLEDALAEIRSVS